MQEMKVVALQRRPSGAGAKPPCAALAEDRRGERQGKGARDASGGDQEDVPEASGRGDSRRASLLKRRKVFRRHRNRGSCLFLRDEPGGCPFIGQVVSGVEAA